MGRALARGMGTVTGAVSLWCSLAAAQTFDDRFANFPGGHSLPSLFTGPSAQTLPARVPMPPPAPHRAGRAAAAAVAPTGPRARQEELLVAAYSAPSAQPANPLFSLWLPRLTRVEPSPATEATLPSAASVQQAPVAPDDPPAAPTIRARTHSNDLAALIAAKAHKHRVPVALAHAVITVESNYNPNVTGRGATLGLMQIKHATAKGIGFSGTAEQLYDPATNLEWGMRYLGGAYRLAKGDICGTIMRYQGGHRAVSMNPVASAYCAKVRHLMAARPDSRRVAGASYGR